MLSVENPVPRIVMADDHAIVRTGFRALIENAGGYRIVAECSSTGEAHDAVRFHAPDILVLDISLPGGGLNLLPDLRQQFPDCRVLILSMHDNPPFVSKALEMGALAYVSKGAAAEELLSALQAVAAGERYVSTDLRVQASGSNQEGLGALSGREHEVFMHLANGRTPKQAAQALGISVKTVYLHRASIREKLMVQSDLQLHQVAVAQGLV